MPAPFAAHLTACWPKPMLPACLAWCQSTPACPRACLAPSQQSGAQAGTCDQQLAMKLLEPSMEIVEMTERHTAFFNVLAQGWHACRRCP